MRCDCDDVRVSRPRKTGDFSPATSFFAPEQVHIPLPLFPRFVPQVFGPKPSDAHLQQTQKQLDEVDLKPSAGTKAKGLAQRAACGPSCSLPNRIDKVVRYVCTQTH